MKDCYIEDFNFSVPLFAGIGTLIFRDRFCGKLAGYFGSGFGHN